VLFPRVPGLVSVVIPSFNCEKYIEACLDSIREQSYPEWEVIVVDDASADLSAERVKKWVWKHALEGRVLLLELPRNTGFSGALTTGYFLSQGEFIAVQDADDLSHPDRLQKQVRFLQEHPHIALVGTNYAAFRDALPQTPKGQPWLRYGKDIRRSYANGKHCVCHGTAMFRAELFDALGGLNRKVKGAEDYEFIARVVSANRDVENLKEILYFYRLHPDQRSRQFFGKRGGTS
jgi:glycosyltransferase involved in cell wall biosynthesis